MILGHGEEPGPRGSTAWTTGIIVALILVSASCSAPGSLESPTFEPSPSMSSTAMASTHATVPELQGLSEAEAHERIVAAGLRDGERTEAFDPVHPAGMIVSQSREPGVLVEPGTPIDVVVSLGPEPVVTAAPDPSPTPPPDPTPTAEPASTPTPKATPTPTPLPRTVHDYRCVSLEEATAMIEADGFEIGVLVGLPDGFDPTRWPGDDIVIRQRPSPTLTRPFGTPIDLTLFDAGSYPEETCPPA